MWPACHWPTLDTSQRPYKCKVRSQSYVCTIYEASCNRIGLQAIRKKIMVGIWSLMNFFTHKVQWNNGAASLWQCGALHVDYCSVIGRATEEKCLNIISLAVHLETLKLDATPDVDSAWRIFQSFKPFLFVVTKSHLQWSKWVSSNTIVWKKFWNE